MSEVKNLEIKSTPYGELTHY
jgi:hypothetical protein